MQSSIDSRHPIKERIRTNTLPVIVAFVPTYGGKQRRKKLKIHPIFIAILPWPSSSPSLISSHERARGQSGAEGTAAAEGGRDEGGRSESASNYATNRCCKNSEQPTAAASAAAALPEVALAAPSQPLPPPPSPGWFYCPKRMEGRDGGKTWPYVRRAEGRGRRMHEARFPFNIFRRVLPLWGVETGEGGRDGEGQRRLL